MKLNWISTDDARTYGSIYVPKNSFLGTRMNRVVAVIAFVHGHKNPWHFAHAVSGQWEVFGEYPTITAAQMRAQADEPALVPGPNPTMPRELTDAERSLFNDTAIEAGYQSWVEQERRNRHMPNTTRRRFLDRIRELIKSGVV